MRTSSPDTAMSSSVEMATHVTAESWPYSSCTGSGRTRRDDGYNGVKMAASPLAHLQHQLPHDADGVPRAADHVLATVVQRQARDHVCNTSRDSKKKWTCRKTWMSRYNGGCSVLHQTKKHNQHLFFKMAATWRRVNSRPSVHRCKQTSRRGTRQTGARLPARQHVQKCKQGATLPACLAQKDQPDGAGFCKKHVH